MNIKIKNSFNNKKEKIDYIKTKKYKLNIRLKVSNK